MTLITSEERKLNSTQLFYYIFTTQR